MAEFEQKASDSAKFSADAEALAAKWHVTEKAVQDANKDYPPEDAKELSSSEQNIVSHFEDWMRDAGATLKAQVDKCRNQMSNIFNDSVLADIRSLPGKLQIKNGDLLTTRRQHLKTLRDEAEERKMALNNFRVENALTERPAEPRDNPMVVVLWMLIIVLVETSLNATFFALGSERGLTGGAVQAFVISFMNATMAWLLGRFCFPRFNHVEFDEKVKGYICTGIIVVAIIVLNLLAGHYRAALEQDPLAAVLVAVRTFAESFAGIKSAQGWLLTGVGIIAASGLSVKVYLSDDPYPGYGKMYRFFREAQDEWEEARANLSSEITANYESVEKERGNLMDKMTRLEIEGRNWLDRARHVVEQYKGDRHKIENKCNEVVAIYRSRNRTVRSRTSAPAYFNQKVCLDIDRFDYVLDLSREEERFKAMLDRFEQFRNQEAEEVRAKIADIHRLTIEDLDAYFLA